MRRIALDSAHLMRFEFRFIRQMSTEIIHINGWAHGLNITNLGIIYEKNFICVHNGFTLGTDDVPPIGAGIGCVGSFGSACT